MDKFTTHMLLSSMKDIEYEYIPYHDIDDYYDASDIFSVGLKGSDFRLLFYINDPGTIDICNAYTIRNGHFIYMELEFSLKDLLGFYQDSHLSMQCYINNMENVKKAILRRCRYYGYLFENKILPQIKRRLREKAPTVIIAEGRIKKQFLFNDSYFSTFVRDDYLISSLVNHLDYFKQEG